MLGYGVAVAILFFVYPLTKAKNDRNAGAAESPPRRKASAVETDGE